MYSQEDTGSEDTSNIYKDRTQAVRTHNLEDQEYCMYSQVGRRLEDQQYLLSGRTRKTET
jgi:hypothetical protein